MKSHIVIAEISHEANTFSPLLKKKSDFENDHLLEGDDILQCLTDTNTEIWGFVRRVRKIDEDVEIIPVIAASAISGGIIEADTFSYLRDRFLDGLNRVNSLDGIYLAMHGAMVADLSGGEDATGLLLEEFRKSVGGDIPIVVTLDLHANVTQKIVHSVNALIGYQTWPHIDQAERGSQAAELLLATIRGELKPVTALSKLPMILQVENGQTTSGPMADLLSRLRRLESEKKCLSGSAFLVQPWMDIRDIGCSVVVVTDNDLETAKKLANASAKDMWRMRHLFDMPLLSIDEAIDYAVEAKGYPIVLADSADSTGSGATGDSTAILKRLLERRISCKVFLTVVDKDVVQEANQVGIGKKIRVSLGGKIDIVNSLPVEIEAIVEWFGSPSFQFKGSFKHGLTYNMGRVVVLQIFDIHILVSERALLTIDPELYRAVGKEPREAKIVVVKSPNLFRAAYEPIAHEILVVDTPGLASSNLTCLSYKNLPHPFYPFDDNFLDW